MSVMFDYNDGVLIPGETGSWLMHWNMAVKTLYPTADFVENISCVYAYVGETIVGVWCNKYDFEINVSHEMMERAGFDSNFAYGFNLEDLKQLAGVE